MNDTASEESVLYNPIAPDPIFKCERPVFHNLELAGHCFSEAIINKCQLLPIRCSLVKIKLYVKKYFQMVYHFKKHSS